jgi:hypothetical protein
MDSIHLIARANNIEAVNKAAAMICTRNPHAQSKLTLIDLSVEGLTELEVNKVFLGLNRSALMGMIRYK